MHPTDDQFTEMIDAIASTPPQPARHRVIWFAIGTGVWLLDAVGLCVLIWFLRLLR